MHTLEQNTSPSSWYQLLGLLVSKFKRGGVNWAYKIFARTHNFSVFQRQKEQIVFTWNRLILQSSLGTIWILFNVKLCSTRNITEPDQLNIVRMKDTAMLRNQSKATQHKISRSMILSQVLMNDQFVHNSLKPLYAATLFMIRNL